MARIKVEEYPHAYLVKGTGDIDAARKAVFKFLGNKKWTRICAMPYRPFWNGEPGGPGQSCVALYFNVGPACDCHEQENKYKP